MAIELDELMNNSASPMKIALDSMSCMDNSASRMSFPRVMNVCVADVLQEGNSKGGLRVRSKIVRTRRVTR